MSAASLIWAVVYARRLKRGEYDMIADLDQELLWLPAFPSGKIPAAITCEVPKSDGSDRVRSTRTHVPVALSQCFGFSAKACTRHNEGQLISLSKSRMLQLGLKTVPSDFRGDEVYTPSVKWVTIAEFSTPIFVDWKDCNALRNGLAAR